METATSGCLDYHLTRYPLLRIIFVPLVPAAANRRPVAAKIRMPDLNRHYQWPVLILLLLQQLPSYVPLPLSLKAQKQQVPFTLSLGTFLNWRLAEGLSHDPSHWG
jgi:hypothetical protein